MLKQGLSQRLLQKLSPQQIQFIQLLQLNSTEFEKRVDEEMTENPALETEEKAEDTAEAEQELEKILKLIHSLEPPGVGARQLEECLLLQLNRMQQTPDVILAKKIIHHYMDDLAKKHYDKLIKSLKINREKLKDVLEIILH